MRADDRADQPDKLVTDMEPLVGLCKEFISNFRSVCGDYAEILDGTLFAKFGFSDLKHALCRFLEGTDLIE